MVVQLDTLLQYYGSATQSCLLCRLVVALDLLHQPQQVQEQVHNVLQAEEEEAAPAAVSVPTHHISCNREVQTIARSTMMWYASVFKAKSPARLLLLLPGQTHTMIASCHLALYATTLPLRSLILNPATSHVHVVKAVITSCATAG